MLSAEGWTPPPTICVRKGEKCRVITRCKCCNNDRSTAIAGAINVTIQGSKRFRKCVAEFIKLAVTAPRALLMCREFINLQPSASSSSDWSTNSPPDLPAVQHLQQRDNGLFVKQRCRTLNMDTGRDWHQSTEHVMSANTPPLAAFHPASCLYNHHCPS